MQTKQQIQNLLASAGTTPNHRRGQNFLIDLNLLRLLIDSADIHTNDIVLEVGCGTGSLTEQLTELAGKVIAVELDDVLTKITAKQLEEKHNLEIITSDILESKNTIDSSVIEAVTAARNEYSGRLMLVANLPYSVASPVMLNLITGSVTADCMYVTVQKEVADRMTAEPGSAHYGTLSIFLAATGDVKILRTLKPTVFWPKPQVDSTMISFIRSRKKTGRINNMQIFRQVVNLFMQHRRKMLKACTRFAADDLENIHNWDSIFTDCAIDSRNRPEQLSADEFLSIANLCNEYLRKT